MGLLQDIRRISATGLRKIADRLSPVVSIYEQNGNKPFSANGWDHIPCNQYDYTPKGTYVSGPANRFLLVPKNRYKLVLLPDQKISIDQGIGWITEDNSAESYDRLWGSGEAMDAFRSEAGHARGKLTVEIVDHIETRLPEQLHVADIGCGAGDLLLEIKNRRPAARVTGLDFSGKAVESAQLQFPEGDFRQFVIYQSLPYADAQFDVVTCTDVLEHLEYPELVMAELVRICSPTGLVVVVVPDGDVDQFFGHYWFWNESSLKELTSKWGGKVARLPETREFIVCIEMPGRK